MKKIIIIPILLLVSVLVVFSHETESIYTKYLGINYDSFWSDKKSPHRVVNNMLAKRTNVTWSSGNHTGSPVPIGSIGPKKYTTQLKGIIQNTDIAKVMKEAVSDNINVIIVIGDGMGFNQMSLPIFKNIASKSGKKTYFEKIMKEGESGAALTNLCNSIVTGSAAAATAIAGGEKTYHSMIGLNEFGEKEVTVLNVAEAKGMATGLVTRAHILDGTPGGFFAHSISRHNYDDIALQLVKENDIEVIFGGGAQFFIPKGKKVKDLSEFDGLDESLNTTSTRADDKNLINMMEDKGYDIICNRCQLSEVDEAEKVFGLFAGAGMTGTIDLNSEKTGEPSLVEMSSTALKKLSSYKNGFFVMIEAARIDWEAHDNDAGAVAQLMDEMNEVIKLCYDYYDQHKDNTLLIFTADHETGGFSMSYTGFQNDTVLTVDFENGLHWKNSTNTLTFDNFLKLYDQKKSYYSIFQEAKSADQLSQLFKDNIQYDFTDEEVGIIFSLLDQYKKAK